ncbi:helix-turn-helix domain-containing protein [Halosquirtibacter laminarini]|uniref:Helix-turn-helix domain-containing protein n=1 Tax=Halosquirtibacter laminarini TaxID=3374600 RepID=A0AC61NH82_9BACT|nr:helix-turn-helix domain-containing protein [Prolixibacteraceae bacterium]
MADTLTKIKHVAESTPSKWIDNATERQQNRAWKRRSFKIAVRVLQEIRAQKQSNGMSQKMLAQHMGVSPQYINKLLKGNENLTLETISKIEEVLQISLIEVLSETTSTTVRTINTFDNVVSSKKAINITEPKVIDLNSYTNATVTNG